MSKKINKFSIPLPATTDWKERVDDVIKLNEKLNNSKVVSFYGCCSDPNWLCGFESLRGSVSDMDNIDYIYNNKYKTSSYIKLEEYIEIIKYVKSKNFDFIYLLNSSFNILPNELNSMTNEVFINKITKLLNLFVKHGIFNIRVSNINLINCINKTYGTLFNIYLSTNNEYSDLLSYSRLIERFNNIKQVCFSGVLNKDFVFLENFRKKFPHIETEILTNESCLFHCPYRREHSMMCGELPIIFHNKQLLDKEKNILDFDVAQCGPFDFDSKLYEIFLTKQVYPWEINAYDGLIDTFKLSGRECIENINDIKNVFLKRVEGYLVGIENFEVIKDYTFGFLFLNRCTNPIMQSTTIGDIKDFLPKIEFFQNKNHSCSNNCGVSCTYCYQLADKYKEYYNNKYIL